MRLFVITALECALPSKAFSNVVKGTLGFDHKQVEPAPWCVDRVVYSHGVAFEERVSHVYQRQIRIVVLESVAIRSAQLCECVEAALVGDEMPDRFGAELGDVLLLNVETKLRRGSDGVGAV